MFSSKNKTLHDFLCNSHRCSDLANITEKLLALGHKQCSWQRPHVFFPHVHIAIPFHSYELPPQTHARTGTCRPGHAIPVFLRRRVLRSIDLEQGLTMLSGRSIALFRNSSSMDAHKTRGHRQTKLAISMTISFLSRLSWKFKSTVGSIWQVRCSRPMQTSQVLCVAHLYAHEVADSERRHKIQWVFRHCRHRKAREKSASDRFYFGSSTQ